MPSQPQDETAILLVDRHRVYRSGLRFVLETHFCPSRVIEASGCEEVSPKRHDLDLVLIDEANLSDESATLLNRLHDGNPDLRVAMLSVANTRQAVLNCLAAGFHGFIDKLQADDDLVAAIHDVLSGRIVAPRWLADRDESGAGRPPPVERPAEPLKLTPRQHEILRLLGQGMSNVEIAAALGIAEGTAKIHAIALMKALGAHSRTEAVFLAARQVRGQLERDEKQRRSARN